MLTLVLYFNLVSLLEKAIVLESVYGCMCKSLLAVCDCTEPKLYPSCSPVSPVSLLSEVSA